MKARAVLKDVGRVLQMSYGQVDRLAKQIPNHPTDPWTLERTLNGVSEFHSEYKSHADVRHLVDLSMRLEGLPRHSSTHAAGVVIGDRPLAELVPLYRDPRSDMPVTQFDMKYVEAAGLVKFDFLGLKTLSVLKKAVEMIADRGVEVDLDTLSWDDPEVYELLQRGDTVGVFQLESEGMRRTLTAVRPTNFGDIIALVSLYRPGPMDNIPMFGHRKGGREPIVYPHPLLETVLGETYGIFVYQEQVMQAAQILAGYSLGGADMLRRAMGKKIQAEMDAQRAGFVEGCLKVNGIQEKQANELFDLIDKFAGYGFNKSHAAPMPCSPTRRRGSRRITPTNSSPRRWRTTSTRPTSSRSSPTICASSGSFACRPRSTPASPISRSSAPTRATPSATHWARSKASARRRWTSSSPSATRAARSSRSTISPAASIRASSTSASSRHWPGAGAFDAIEPNRAGMFAAAETVLAVAQRTHESRTSGQGGLFGESEPGGGAIALPRAHTGRSPTASAPRKTPSAIISRRTRSIATSISPASTAPARSPRSAKSRSLTARASAQPSRR
jgi:DNA polymerase-3 subunit alpha